MNDPTLSQEQRAVIDSNTHQFTVKAAAGSGKTSVLVQKYVGWVEAGLAPDSIATLTYTRKAAAEMKTRIICLLRARGMLTEARAAEGAPIQTIHGFCERILREHAVEAQVDPEFGVTDDAEAQIRREQAIAFAIIRAWDESEWASKFLRSYAGEGTYKVSASRHGKLREAVDPVMSALRSSYCALPEIRKNYETPESAIRTWAAHAFAKFPESVVSDLNQNLPPQWGALLTERIQALGEKPPRWLRNQTAESDYVTAADSCGLMWLVCTAWEYLEDSMDRDQEFDFSLLERKTIELLDNSEETRGRLRDQIKALLIDEGQDLNPLQYSIIDKLSPQQNMMVGDPQQSIYGFRFSEPRLFTERASTGETYSLSRNFRSSPGILSFVDEVFSSIWNQDYVKMAPPIESDDPFGPTEKPPYDGVELWPMKKGSSSEVAEGINQLVGEGVAFGDIAVLCRGTKSVQKFASRFRAARLPHKIVGSTSRFYAKLEIKDVANTFAALSNPYDDFALLACLHGPFCGVSLDCVAFLAANSPVCERMSLPGPWGQGTQNKLDQFHEWFAKARHLVDRTPAWETMAFIFKESPFLQNVSRAPDALQSLANIRKLLTLASKQSGSTARAFAEWIKDIEFLEHREDEAPVYEGTDHLVTISTIHAAKGLEYPVVVLPDTHRELRGIPRPIAMDPLRGLVVAGLRSSKSRFYEWLKELKSEMDFAEELRVEYVAMTRAKERLCVAVDPEAKKNTMAAIAAKLSGFPDKTHLGVKVRNLEPR